ncbi:MAG: cation diffusion facilitator family transporter [Candidatus Cloacimonetes bacterium]|nr:cation diffusion facilitator family transporter [Candidatus Cloacimonadota bacterium]
MRERKKIVDSAVDLGLGANIFLALIKTFAGIIWRSQALLADGINSSADVVYYAIVKILLKLAGKPADKEHPYGHLQLESIASLVVGAFVLTTAVSVFWYSINSMKEIINSNGHDSSGSYLVMSVALFTVFSKIILYLYTKRSYQLTRNPALKALASDHINDIFASVSVSIGVVLTKIGYLWVDPLAGAFVALFILKTGIEIIKDSSAQLMDTFPDKDFRKEISSVVTSHEQVLAVDDIGIHRFGPKFILNISLQINGSLSVREGDNISDEVEAKLYSYYENTLSKVNIHYHPPKQDAELSKIGES